MRYALLLTALTALSTIGTPTIARSESWCSMASGGTACGFVSYEQCMANLWGNGTVCRPSSSASNVVSDHANAYGRERSRSPRVAR
jgi:hypothetical protein